MTKEEFLKLLAEVLGDYYKNYKKIDFWCFFQYIQDEVKELK